MTRVEERLTELLHAATPRSQGVAWQAVEREVRRRRTVRWSVAASAAAVAVVATTVTLSVSSGDPHHGKLATSPTVSLAGTVPWLDKPAPPYREPTAQPTKPATDARRCAAGDVTATVEDGNGAGGHQIMYVQFRNTSSSTCVLKGYPDVTATQPGHPDVTATDGSFFSAGATADMRPGQVTSLGVETDTSCAARPSGGPAGPGYHHLQITLPGGGTVEVVEQGDGLDVTCGVHLTRFFVRPATTTPPRDPQRDLEVSLEVPPSIAAGSTLVYVVNLTNPTDQAVSLDRCPGYVETAAVGPTPLQESHALNCAPVTEIAAHGTARFQMRLRVPAQTWAGPMPVRWSLATPFSVAGRARVTVVSAAHP